MSNLMAGVCLGGLGVSILWWIQYSFMRKELRDCREWMNDLRDRYYELLDKRIEATTKKIKKSKS